MKKMLLFTICLFINGCSDETTSQKVQEPDRIQVKTDVIYKSERVLVFVDIKTGREFLSYSTGLVEIKPKGE